MWREVSESEDEYNGLLERVQADAGSAPALTPDEVEVMRDRSAEDQAFVGNVLFGIGLAGVVGGTLLLILDAGNNDPEEPNRVGFAPFTLSHGAGVGWTGRF